MHVRRSCATSSEKCRAERHRIIVGKYVARGSDEAAGAEATFLLGSAHDDHEGMIAGKDAFEVASEAEETVV